MCVRKVRELIANPTLSHQTQNQVILVNSASAALLPEALDILIHLHILVALPAHTMTSLQLAQLDLTLVKRIPG